MLNARARYDATARADDRRLDVSRAPAVARAATILRLLAAERSGLGVTEIARRVGLVPSTCLHVLRALVDEGFTSFDPERKTYQTGAGLLTLVRDAMASSEYPKLAQPELDELTARYCVTAIAAELDSRGRMVLVSVTRADDFISLHVNVGSRVPAYIGASGRCLAAMSGLSREGLKKEFDALRWEKVPRFEDWHAEVERARIEGVATDRGNYIRGLTMVGALLPPGTDQAVRSIAVVGFEHEMTDKVLRALAKDVRRSAEALAEKLRHKA